MRYIFSSASCPVFVESLTLYNKLDYGMELTFSRCVCTESRCDKDEGEATYLPLSLLFYFKRWLGKSVATIINCMLVKESDATSENLNAIVQRYDENWTMENPISTKLQFLKYWCHCLRNNDVMLVILLDTSIVSLLCCDGKQLLKLRVNAVICMEFF